MNRSTAIVHMRVWPKDKASWVQAARKNRQSLSAWIVQALVRAVEQGKGGGK